MTRAVLVSNKGNSSWLQNVPTAGCVEVIIISADSASVITPQKKIKQNKNKKKKIHCSGSLVKEVRKMGEKQPCSHQATTLSMI